MLTVENLRLDEEINRHFVVGLLKGYQRYLEVRVAASVELEVSNGYAYTRGNHLEDKIAKEKIATGITFDTASAGSWKYLQFEINQSNEKYLVIVRRSERIEETQKELQKKSPNARSNNWLYKLSRNNDNLKLSKIETDDSTSQIKLFGDSMEEQKAIFQQIELDVNIDVDYDGFYILSYEINPDTYMIDDASLLMMDSLTLKLVEIERFTELVRGNQTLIDMDLLDQARGVIEPEELSAEAAEYDVEVAKEEVSADEPDYSIEETQGEEQIEENQ